MRFRHFCRDRKGAVAMITALSLLVLVGFTAGAVDFGHAYLKARQLQGIADLAAMAAAGHLDRAVAAANATARENDWGGAITAQVVTGTYQPLATLAPSARFVAGAAPADAAQVTLEGEAPLYFASVLLGRSGLTIRRSATAARAELVSFSIGSRLLQIKGGIANALLSALTGSTVNLSAMDYNSLAGAQVDLFRFSDALKTRLDLQAASFNQTMAAKMTGGDVLNAIADVLRSDGARDAARAMGDIANAANSQPVALNHLLDLGPYGDQDFINPSHGSGVSVGALDLAAAVLTLAQGGHQVSFDVAANVPGLTKITATLAIGERPANSPWIAITSKDDVIVRTAQARLWLKAEILPQGSALSGIASITVPVLIELASAEAKLSALTCGAAPEDDHVTLSVQPSIGQAALASLNSSDLSDFERALNLRDFTLINTALLQVSGFAQAKLGGVNWQSVDFDAAEIASGTTKTVRTDDLAQGLFSTLLGKLSLRVKLLGLGIGLGQNAVTAAMSNTLQAVAAPLDDTINGLTGLAGVSLGEADVRVNGIRCQNVALVR
ncbi:MAG: hypothetical protein J0I26_13550 [Alphaproteobacteria bacterium]|nr:hypothetical protein [Alphaproteobacteria bacterium]